MHYWGPGNAAELAKSLRTAAGGMRLRQPVRRAGEAGPRLINDCIVKIEGQLGAEKGNSPRGSCLGLPAAEAIWR